MKNFILIFCLFLFGISIPCFAQMIGISIGIPHGTPISAATINGGGNAMTFNGATMTFNGSTMTFTHS